MSRREAKLFAWGCVASTVSAAMDSGELNNDDILTEAEQEKVDAALEEILAYARAQYAKLPDGKYEYGWVQEERQR